MGRIVLLKKNNNHIIGQLPSGPLPPDIHPSGISQPRHLLPDISQTEHLPPRH